jgi:hypothetical protein
MRLGIVTIPQSTPGLEPSAIIDRITTFGERVEALEFSGLWVTDAFGRGRPTLDPLIFLGALCSVTKTIELGTCVVQIPLRHPVEHAHRVQTLNLLSAGRLRFGAGTGSTKLDFDAVEADFDARFKTLPKSLEIMRRTWAGEAVFGPSISVWPGTEGGPPVLLGAWRSERWINLAARHCQGWISSGIHSKWEDLEIGIGMYRAAGGNRAVLANILTDLRPDAPANPMFAHANVSIQGSAAVGRDTLKRLVDLGFDDALLICPFDDPDQLEAIRGLAG